MIYVGKYFKKTLWLLVASSPDFDYDIFVSLKNRSLKGFVEATWLDLYYAIAGEGAVMCDFVGDKR